MHDSIILTVHSGVERVKSELQIWSKIVIFYPTFLIEEQLPQMQLNWYIIFNIFQL